MRNQLILQAMQEEDGAPGMLDSIDISEAFIYKRGDHKAQLPKEASRDILDRGIGRHQKERIDVLKGGEMRGWSTAH